MLFDGSIRLFSRSRKFCVFAIAALIALAVSVAFAQDAARDQWQRPAEVMDALGVTAGSSVADVGAGDGYFTWHLAERVGTKGRVYAEDIVPSVIADLKRQGQDKGLKQVEVIEGTESDPRLPAGALDAVIVVNAYHEMDEHSAMLKGIMRALKPGGRLGIIDKEAETGHDRTWYHSHHRIAKEVVRQEATGDGFEFRGEKPGFVRPPDSKWYFLVFVKGR